MIQILEGLHLVPEVVEGPLTEQMVSDSAARVRTSPPVRGVG